MTDPPAWPDVDEDMLEARADVFDAAANLVADQRESAKGERAELFGAVGTWSGAGSTAAARKLDQQISDLDSLVNSLAASAQLFKDCRDAIVRAKNAITDNTIEANQSISDIRNNS
ncbi:WXG100-like domain-containing protein, partial [Mycolicibacter minnesotensis]